MVSPQARNPAPLELGTSWETYCENIWRDVDLLDETSVLAKGWEFVSVALNCFSTMDFKVLANSTNAYNWVSPKVPGGAPADLYDWAAMTQSMVAAECCCNLLLFDQAYALVENCLELLDFSGNARPNRHLRLATLRIISECKWQQPNSKRDKLWSPEWIYEQYERKYLEVLELLEERPEVNQDGSFTDSLETTGFAILKMATRYLPGQVPEMVREYNARWSASLAVEPGHFLENDHCGEKARVYWDFEIVKQWIKGNLTLEDLDYCQGQLVQAVQNELEGDQTNVLLSLDLQYRYMAQRFTNILEFPIG